MRSKPLTLYCLIDSPPAFLESTKVAMRSSLPTASIKSGPRKHILFVRLRELVDGTPLLAFVAELGPSPESVSSCSVA